MKNPIPGLAIVTLIMFVIVVAWANDTKHTEDIEALTERVTALEAAHAQAADDFTVTCKVTEDGRIRVPIYDDQCRVTGWRDQSDD